MSRQVADHSHIQQSVTIVHTSRVFEWRSSRVFAMQHDLFDHLQNFQPPQGGRGKTPEEKRKIETRRETLVRGASQSAEPIHQRHNLCSATSQFQKRANIPTCLGPLRGTFHEGW